MSNENYLKAESLEESEMLRTVLCVDGKCLYFVLGPWSGVSFISESCYRNTFASCTLTKTNSVYRSYTGSAIIPTGVFKVNVQTRKTGRSAWIYLYVIPGSGNPLLGLRDMNKLGFSFQLVMEVSTMEGLIERFSTLFSRKLGKCNGVKLTLELKSHMVPKHYTKVHVPHSMNVKMEREIRKLLKEKIITQVRDSIWATPLVPVLTKNNTVELYGNYRKTLNKFLNVRKLHIPTIEDVASALNATGIFTRLDLSNSYQQFELCEESKKVTTITCQKGLFQFNRWPPGLASNPGLFQREMEKVVDGLSGVALFLDQILIGGTTWTDHLENVGSVLRRLQNKGFTLMEDKCQFAVDKIDILGYILDKDGLRRSNQNFRAILDIPNPRNVAELEAFLGLVHYYSGYVPYSAIIKPFKPLLDWDARWAWSKECTQMMDFVTHILVSDRVVCTHSEKLPLLLATNSSKRGVGAVISHVFQNGTERPIGFASKRLRKGERECSEIVKKATAIMFGVKKFHQYLWGRKFTIVTDNKYLVSIFGPKQRLPSAMAIKLHRYSLFLSDYDFDIIYKDPTELVHAYALSRFPIRDNICVDDDFSYLNCIQEELKCLTVDDVADATRKDPVLKNVIARIKSNSWDGHLAKEMKPYLIRRNELYVEQGCVMWGYRLVVPGRLRNTVMAEMLDIQSDAAKLKTFARSYVWWPDVDNDFKMRAKQEDQCQ